MGQRYTWHRNIACAVEAKARAVFGHFGCGAGTLVVFQSRRSGIPEETRPDLARARSHLNNGHQQVYHFCFYALIG